MVQPQTVQYSKSLRSGKLWRIMPLDCHSRKHWRWLSTHTLLPCWRWCLPLEEVDNDRNLTDEERIFNYRLSWARQVVENAFGICANRFRWLLTTLQQTPETVRMMVLACVCLHNLMRKRYPTLQNSLLDHETDDHQIIRGAWRHEGVLQDMNNVTGPTQASRDGKKQRVYLKHYYNNIGAVP